jgi:hypothetical protein
MSRPFFLPLDDYRSFQVAHIWVIDPIKRVGWDCSDGNWTELNRFQAAGRPVYLDLSELFAQLDEAEA